MSKIRKFDDTIINILNTELPTQSFANNSNITHQEKCQHFKEEVCKRLKGFQNFSIDLLTMYI
jgi:hypothetical protein